VPNGVRGDHPITDITDYGLTVFGPTIDGLIAELARQGRRDELDDEVDLSTSRQPSDLLEQIQAIADRKHPSVSVRFHWEASGTAERMAKPWGGWSYTSCVALTDPTEGVSTTWAMRFHIQPFSCPDGSLLASARFLSDSAPWDELLPGSSFWMVSYGAVAEVVVEPGP
jgi:hypothetical protein